jgi:hypothetical protein
MERFKFLPIAALKQLQCFGTLSMLKQELAPIKAFYLGLRLFWISWLFPVL